MTRYRRRDAARHPPLLAPDYKTSVVRAPRLPPLSLDQTRTEATGPVFAADDLGALDHDLTRNHGGEGVPLGEPMILHGRVLDGGGRPVPGTLVEIWQANAAGRYRHVRDRHTAPTDPNFGGCGRRLTDGDGSYAFRTVRPGAYPWPNRLNDWRPAHVHFSVFGPAFCQRLVTQCYFEGDPLIARCPIAGAVPDGARDALVARLDIANSRPFEALAWRFDIVLRGPRSSLFET